MRIYIPGREVNPEDEPDLAGERLRDLFFDQTKGLGCYYSFDTRPRVVGLGESPIGGEWNEGINWQCFQLGSFEMRYYWDGDGVLQFRLPDGSWLSNSDCKKSYNWEYETPDEHKARWEIVE